MKRVSNAVIRRAWLDVSITAAQAAAKVGISDVTLWRRAKRLGLQGRRGAPPLVFDGPEFAALWRAGVRRADIAALFGGTASGVRHAVARMGLPPRPLGLRPITLEQYRARVADELLAARMAAAARQEAQALRLAEMVDGPSRTRAA